MPTVTHDDLKAAQGGKVKRSLEDAVAFVLSFDTIWCRGMSCTSENQVLGFLKRFKGRIDKSGLKFTEREECYNAIIDMGLTLDDAEWIISDLRPKDYIEGPKRDRSGMEGEIWVFGREEKGTMLYIKLKIDKVNVKCLSFHPARQQMRFPYR